MPLSSVVGAQSLIKPGVATSTTRPAAPFEGQLIYESDTGFLKIFDGTNWYSIVEVEGDQSILANQIFG